MWHTCQRYQQPLKKAFLNKQVLNKSTVRIASLHSSRKIYNESEF